ncbi:signal peptidase I [Candidatus Latescibacterota bacterium]
MTSTNKAKKEKSQTDSGFTRLRKDWIEPIVIAFLLASVIRSFIIQPFRIPSGSMEETLLTGDQLMAARIVYGIKLPYTNKFIVRFRDPKPSEVIVFKYPMDPSKDFIKRCVAVGGQKLEIRNKKVYVDDKLQEYPESIKFIDSHIYPPHIGPRDNYGPITVPEGHMFVMGDNRDNSNDSRFWGFVPYDNIKGKAIIIWWSWNHDVPLYDIIHRVRWPRIFNIIR